VECFFGELLQGAQDEREHGIVKSYRDSLPKADEDRIWIEAGEYSSEDNLISNGVGLIDSVIIVAAMKSNALVWILDAKLNAALSDHLNIEIRISYHVGQ
jgi:hypothetical protein